MHFKHPELLYALLLLLIPIVVHLFQLRRFQREEFTNVKFLKKISRETRKSSQLKKWLVLITRLLGMAALVLAFAQPFFLASEKALQNTEKLIYLDNSFSMQASGPQGQLFPASVQALLENLPEEGEFNLITNNSEFKNISASELRNELQNLDYSPTPLSFKDVDLRAENFLESKNLQKEVVIISDFQQIFGLPAETDTSRIQYNLVVQRPENVANFSIDSAFVAETSPENLDLKILLSGHTENAGTLAVSLFSGEQLLGKSSAEFEGNGKAELNFRIKNEAIPSGRIEIEDNSLQFDNRLYFSINENRPIKVIAVSEAESSFLAKIFNQPEFDFQNFENGQIDYNRLNAANLIILNEIKDISPTLAGNLEELSRNGTIITIIPSAEANIPGYNSLLRSLNLPGLRESRVQESLITEVSFEHPLYRNVFEKQVENFEYPKVQTSFSLNSNSAAILSFQDNSPFLLQENEVFLFTAPLNGRNTNFKRSPLVVPSFYNMGLQALKTPQLYYELGRTNQIDIPVQTGKDEVLHLVSEEESFIPQQQVFSDKVQLTIDQSLGRAGSYRVEFQGEELGNLSFNFNRSESDLTYADVESVKNANVLSSVETYFEEAKAASEMNVLWKWFVIFALFCFITEMLLLKFLK